MAEMRPTSIDSSPEALEARLRLRIRSASSVVVAYSGGVDSTYLAHIATEELGESAVCITGISPSVSQYQRERAAMTAASLGFNHVTISTEELDNPDYRANSPMRCFHCKSELYGKLADLAKEMGDAVVFDGTNADDLSDHRPGREAAVNAGVESPLADLGYSKEAIRERSRVHGLETAEMPASPCLASRIQHGTPVTIEKLSKVEQGESYLRSLGFREFRVRSHGDLARLEFSLDEMERAFQTASDATFASRFVDIGFRYITIDVQGFRSGSMNPKPGVAGQEPSS